jgi:septum formation protein
MMHLLSGNTHRVLSSYCILAFGRFMALEDGPRALEIQGHPAVLFSGFESTEVDFTTLAPETIEAYVKTKDPYDKAGGYGIQGIAAQFVSAIRGDFYNVVGLPICQVCKILRTICLGKLP